MCILASVGTRHIASLSTTCHNPRDTLRVDVPSTQSRLAQASQSQGARRTLNVEKICEDFDEALLYNGSARTCEPCSGIHSDPLTVSSICDVVNVLQHVSSIFPTSSLVRHSSRSSETSFPGRYRQGLFKTRSSPSTVCSPRDLKCKQRQVLKLQLRRKISITCAKWQTNRARQGSNKKTCTLTKDLLLLGSPPRCPHFSFKHGSWLTLSGATASRAQPQSDGTDQRSEQRAPPIRTITKRGQALVLRFCMNSKTWYE